MLGYDLEGALLKRRLAKRHAEELDALLSLQAHDAEHSKAGGASDDAPEKPSREVLVAARKQRLEELYQELCSEYDACLKRCGS